MKQIFKKPYFISAVLFATILILVIAGKFVFGWTAPTQNPPLGSPALYYDSVNSRVGISNSSPTEKLDITGNLKFSGSLTGGSVPWARITSFPSACSAGQYVSAVGGTLTCSTPTGGAVTSVTGSSGVTASPTTGAVGVSLTYPSKSCAVGSAIRSFDLSGATAATCETIGAGGGGGWTDGGTSVYLTTTGDSVGIGTTNPSASAKVDIRDNTLAPLSWGNANAVGFLGHNGNNALIGANGTTGGSLVLKANGTETLYISNGNVGIGNTSPATKLDVSGTITTNYLEIDPQDGTNEGGELLLKGAGSYGAINFDNYQGNARIFTLATGKQFQVLGGSGAYIQGNLGVGKNPSYRLDVVGDIAVDGVDAIRRDGTNAYLFPWSTGYANNRVVIGGGTNTNLQVSGHLGVKSLESSFDSLYVLSDTSQANSGSYFTDGSRSIRLLPGNINAGAYNSIVQANDNALIFSSGSQGTGAFVIAPWASANSGLRIDSTGAVNIKGSAASGGALLVEANSIAATLESRNNGSGNAVRGISNGNDIGVYGYGLGLAGVYGNGNTGVYGTGSLVGVRGDGGPSSSGVMGYNSNSNGIGVYGQSTTNYGVYCNGITCGGNRAWTNSSDIRLKDNIKTIENPLSKVLNLRGVEYAWKDDPTSKIHLGFIAQEVLPILPEVISQDNEGYYSMTQSEITAVLVEAIKEQQKQIETLKTDINTLKK